MDVDAVQVPVVQSGSPAPQSAPSTPQKSSEKIQDNDGGNSDDHEEEDVDEEEDGPSKPRKRSSAPVVNGLCSDDGTESKN